MQGTEMGKEEEITNRLNAQVRLPSRAKRGVGERETFEGGDEVVVGGEKADRRVPDLHTLGNV